MYKSIAIVYPKEAKRPILIGYTGKVSLDLKCFPPYTVRTHSGPIETGLSTMDDVCKCIEQNFSKEPSFKWLPLFDLDSLLK